MDRQLKEFSKSADEALNRICQQLEDDGSYGTEINGWIALAGEKMGCFSGNPKRII